MGLLWPTKIKSEPGLTVRVGRVVHWLFTLMSVMALLLLAWGLYYTLRYEDWWSQGGPLVVTLAVAVFSFALGRGLRYIIAAE